MQLQDKLKTALDETRLLILGAQILLGFQLNGIFQDSFDTLEATTRLLDAAAFLLMTMTIALLIAPAMQHRLVERGVATQRMHRATTFYASWALIPLGVSLGIDLFIVLQRHFGDMLATVTGLIFFVLAMALWFAAAWFRKRHDLLEKAQMTPAEKTPLHSKIEQMLTEARVLLPGAQALLGFQMAVMLTSGFDKLPAASKLIHTAALCCIALSVVLLITPAAFHRIAYAGEDSEEFHTIGTRFIVAAALPLAAGITLDLYVAITKASGSALTAAIAAAFAAATLIGLWFLRPLALRAKKVGPS